MSGHDGVAQVIPVKTELDMTGQWPGVGACLGLLELTRLEKGTGLPTLSLGLHSSLQQWY